MLFTVLIAAGVVLMIAANLALAFEDIIDAKQRVFGTKKTKED